VPKKFFRRRPPIRCDEGIRSRDHHQVVDCLDSRLFSLVDRLSAFRLPESPGCGKRRRHLNSFRLRYDPCMITASYKPKKKFMQLAIAEAKRARDRGDYAIGAVITRVMSGREVVIASAGNRVKTSGSSIKHVELETLKYVSSGYGRYLTEFVLYSTHEPCAMCAGACVWARIGAVVYGVAQEDIAAYGRKRGTEEYKWRACLIPCRFVLEKGNHSIPVIGGFLHAECKKLFDYRAR
jgi:tRNA(adenine34) deaminase